jgi:hypothetical protein
MEFIRRDISEVLADLPEICAAHLPRITAQSSSNAERADRETRTGLHVDRYHITRAGQKAARASREAAAA